MSLRRRSVLSQSDSDSDHYSARRIPSGFLAVYVGEERRRFVIPARFMNLPVFGALLNRAEEEFGFQPSGGLVLPCELPQFKGLLKLLEIDEQRFGILGLDELFAMSSQLNFVSCKEINNACLGFTPLLEKARV